MPDIAKLLEQNNAGFKRYTGIQKANSEQMLEAITANNKKLKLKNRSIKGLVV